MEEKKQYDFIEIISIISKKISAGIKNFINLIINNLLFCWQYKIYIICLLIISAIAGFSYFKLTKRYFVTEAILENYVAHSSDFINYINKTKYFNETILATEFAIPQHIAKQIKAIKACYLIDESHDSIADYIDYKNKASLRDTNFYRIPKRFAVVLSVYDTGIIHNYLEQGLLNYLNKNSFFIKRNKMRLDFLTKNINNYTKEIAKLDSYQRQEYFVYRNIKDVNNQTKITVVADRSQSYTQNLLHYDLIHLKNNETNAQQQKEFLSDIVNYIEPFYTPGFYKNTLTKAFLTISLPLFIICYLILFFIINRKKTIS